jgi:hypothetical protein
VSCAACQDIRQRDGVPPLCEGETGCPIPPLGAKEARALHLYRLLSGLHGLVEAAPVLRAVGADHEDLALLAVLRDELAREEAQGR